MQRQNSHYSLHQILRWRASHQPHQRAYTYLMDGEAEEIHLTYEELDRQARAIGAWLQAFGATGERALLLFPPGLEYIAAFFGCLYAGVIAVPAYPPRSNRHLDRLRAIVVDAQATIVLTQASLLSKRAPSCVQALDLRELRWLATDRLPNGIADHWREPDVSGETLAFLQYTSGSTSTPKGVMVSHANILHNEQAIQSRLQSREKITGVTWLPPYHDMGLIGGVIHPLYVGFPAIILSPLHVLQRPFRWLQAISRYQATISGGPNFAYDLCVNRTTPAQRATLNLESWRVAFNGAEPIRTETLTRFTAVFQSCGFRPEAFYPCYGLAEATLLVSGGARTAAPVVKRMQKAALQAGRVAIDSREENDAVTLVGCGQAIPGQQIVIVHPDNATRCAPDEVGEIWVSGSSVAQGYWGKRENTQYTFQAQLAGEQDATFLRTGDLGFLHEGELFVTGRLKDLIIIHGRNLYPHDLERTVEKSWPGLRPGGGAVFSLAGVEGESLVVVHELELRQAGDIAAAIRAIRQAVSEEYEVRVDSIVLIKAGTLPKTSSGKVQRYVCREQFLAGTLAVIGESRATVVLQHVQNEEHSYDVPECTTTA